MPTEIWHWLRSVPEEEKDEEKATLIKSRDPHLAGREQQVSHVHPRDPSPTLLAAATSSMDQPWMFCSKKRLTKVQPDRTSNCPPIATRPSLRPLSPPNPWSVISLKNQVQQLQHLAVL